MWEKAFMSSKTRIFFSLGVGSVAYYYVDEQRKKYKRKANYEKISEKFNSTSIDKAHLCARSIGGIGSDPGITYYAKLHRLNQVSSHQYPNRPLVTKTGIPAQCVSFINAPNSAPPFAGTGDLYTIQNSDVTSDMHGIPAIYNGDAATQLRFRRPFDLSSPKQVDVAYIRREHHYPQETCPPYCTSIKRNNLPKGSL